MTQKIRVGIYARFSTDRQRDASIEDQIQSCRDFAIRQGWEIVQSYSDGAISGASMFRAGIELLQRDAKAGHFDIILSEAMDRLSRNLGDIAKFHERMEHLNVKIWTMTEGHVDQMIDWHEGNDERNPVAGHRTQDCSWPKGTGASGQVCWRQLLRL